LFCVSSCFYVSYNFVRVDGLFFTYWRELHRIDKTFKVSRMNTAILSHRYVICYLLRCAGRCEVSCHHLHLYWTPESFHLTHLHSVIYSFNASSVNNMADVRTDDSQSLINLTSSDISKQINYDDEIIRLTKTFIKRYFCSKSSKNVK
jgi:hypothetical protein